MSLRSRYYNGASYQCTIHIVYVWLYPGSSSAMIIQQNQGGVSWVFRAVLLLTVLSSLQSPHYTTHATPILGNIEARKKEYYYNKYPPGNPPVVSAYLQCRFRCLHPGV